MSVGRCAIPLVGFSGDFVRLSPYPAALSGSGEDSSVFMPGSVVGSSVAQAAVVKLPRGVVSSVRLPLDLFPLLTRRPKRTGCTLGHC